MLDHYEIIRTLGKGASAKVKLARDTNTNEQYALKILKRTTESMATRFADMTANEIQALGKINHPNIVNVMHSSENAMYMRKNGNGEFAVMYLVLELCENGELFDVLFQTGQFEEKLARAFFHQTISGLEACHNSGMCHRDMKPENLLFDANFNVKIADFGFAVVLSGRDGTGMLHTHLGTENYMAPEIHARKAYNGISVDLFALGIILFIMMSKNPPFARPEANDQFYKMLYTGNERFWALHSRNKPQDFYSPELRSLLTSMLALDPTQRLSIAEIKAHPWFNGPVADSSEVQAELSGRKRMIEEAVERARQAKLARLNAAPQRFGVQAGGRAFKAGLEESMGMSKTAENFTERRLDKYSGSANKYTEFFSTYGPDELMMVLADYLDNMEDAEKTIVADEKTYKFSFTCLKDVEELKFDVKIMTTDNSEINAVSFTKNSGSKIEFLELYEKLIADLPDLADSLSPNSTN